MKNSKLITVAAVTGLALSAASCDAIVLNFANLPGTEINFNDGGFAFTSNGNGDQFDIVSQMGGVGDSIGLDGYIAETGPFMIGSISSQNTIIGTIESASVSGAGVFNIVDGSSLNLTGTIQWNNITTFGAAGGLDLTGTVNLTGISYSGSNSDLLALASAGSATDIISFQFASEESLTQLAAANNLYTSYAGTIAAVPEPGTLTLLGAGLSGLFALRLRKRA